MGSNPTISARFRSNPAPVVLWGISAVGSASHWQCGGQGFKSPMLHQLYPVRNKSFLPPKFYFILTVEANLCHKQTDRITENQNPRSDTKRGLLLADTFVCDVLFRLISFISGDLTFSEYPVSYDERDVYQNRPCQYDGYRFSVFMF